MSPLYLEYMTYTHKCNVFLLLFDKVSVLIFVSKYLCLKVSLKSNNSVYL